jgi:diacylglycerol O-acyltransferase / wax synthase
MHEYSAILGPVDSAFYYVERRETPMNIGALAIFDGIIDFDELVRMVDSRSRDLPRYCERVIQATMHLGQPTWVADPDFYIGNHVMRASVSAPGTDEELREAAGQLLSSPLDRSKPLWEIYLLEGLKSGSALFLKVHHCMVDGLAAIDLFTALMDFGPTYHVPKHKPLHDPPSLPNTSQLLVDSLLRDVSHRFGIMKRLRDETVRVAEAVAQPEKRLKMLVAAAHMINNNLKPIKKLPINGVNTGHQTLVWTEFPLEVVNAIRTHCHASINDVMLAVMTRAVASYVRARGDTEQPFLRVLMPVNVRTPEEQHDYGNRISVLPVDLPLHIEDPMKHLAAVTHFTKVMKESSLSYSMELILTLPSLALAPFQPLIWGAAPTVFSLLAHTWCTNVASPSVPVYVVGQQMKHVYGFFPLNPSMGLAGVIVSYNGQISLTLVLDKGIIDAPAELESNLVEAFDALRNAAGITSAAPEPMQEKAPVLNGTSPNGKLPAEAVLETSIASTSTIVETRFTASVTVDEVHIAPAAPEPEPPPAPVTYPLFSDPWAKAMHAVINRSTSYRRVSGGWTAGPLAFMLRASTPAAVLLDLYRGECRAASATSVPEAMKRAAFVIEGDMPAWLEVLEGRSTALAMLTQGKLHLKKGTLFQLLPYTRSAGELVRCAQDVPFTP